MIGTAFRSVAARAGTLFARLESSPVARAAGRIKEAADWISFANDNLTALGVFQRAAAVASIGAAVVATPVAARTIERMVVPSERVVYTGETFVPQSEAQKAPGDDGGAYAAAYLRKNRPLMNSIRAACDNGVERNMDRCNQVSIALSMDNTDAQIEYVRRMYGR